MCRQVQGFPRSRLSFSFMVGDYTPQGLGCSALTQLWFENIHAYIMEGHRVWVQQGPAVSHCLSAVPSMSRQRSLNLLQILFALCRFKWDLQQLKRPHVNFRDTRLLAVSTSFELAALLPGVSPLPSPPHPALQLSSGRLSPSPWVPVPSPRLVLGQVPAWVRLFLGVAGYAATGTPASLQQLLSPTVLSLFQKICHYLLLRAAPKLQE